MADTIIGLKRPSDWFNEKGEFTRRAFRFFDNLTEVSNETVIVVEATEQALTSTSSRVSRNAARINSLELKRFEILEVLADITTDLNQMLICRNVTPITVTLDPDAVEEDEVHIKRRGESITVVGLIDGENDQIINVLNWNAHYVFNGTDWSSM
jgi:hypothetical protein